MLATKRLPSPLDLPGRDARGSGMAGRDRHKDTQVTVTGMALAEPVVDDDTLLARIAGGDRGAFTVLATRHTARALSVAQRVLNQVECP